MRNNASVVLVFVSLSENGYIFFHSRVFFILSLVNGPYILTFFSQPWSQFLRVCIYKRKIFLQFNICLSTFYENV